MWQRSSRLILRTRFWAYFQAQKQDEKSLHALFVHTALGPKIEPAVVFIFEFNFAVQDFVIVVGFMFWADLWGPFSCPENGPKARFPGTRTIFWAPKRGHIFGTKMNCAQPKNKTSFWAKTVSKWWAKIPSQNMGRASFARTVRARISCSIFRTEFWAWFLAPRFVSFWSPPGASGGPYSVVRDTTKTRFRRYWLADPWCVLNSWGFPSMELWHSLASGWVVLFWASQDWARCDWTWFVMFFDREFPKPLEQV